MDSRHSHYQEFDGYFMDQRKLINKLNNIYGENNFKVQLRLNRYKIYPIETTIEQKILSDHDIQACRTQRRRGY